jgi:hypothetical protein
MVAPNAKNAANQRCRGNVCLGARFSAAVAIAKGYAFDAIHSSQCRRARGSVVLPVEGAIKESVSPFENAFQIRTHRLDEESHDQNEGSSLKSIGRVHLIAAY